MKAVAKEEPIPAQTDRFELFHHLWHYTWPETFRDDVRVYPGTFTRIFNRIEAYLIFQSRCDIP